MKYIIRIICLPFWLIVGLISMTASLIQRSILFVKYGGECITYLPEDKATIKEIYDQIKCNSVIHFEHRDS